MVTVIHVISLVIGLKKCRVAPRRSTKYVNINYFSPIVDMNLVCYKCDNFGHIAKNCRLNYGRPIEHYERKRSKSPKVNNGSHILEKKADKKEKKLKKV